MADITDGMVNLVSGMGTARDKAGQATYSPDLMSDLDLVNAYKASSLARRVVDMPAEDATRDWREWSADDTDVSVIERTERRLNVKQKVKKAMKFARLFGGAALLIGNGDTDPSQPLDQSRVKRNGIKYLTMLTMRDLSPGPLSDDFTCDNFGMPEYWTLNTAGKTGIRVHPSRLVIFHGQEPLGDYDVTRYIGWGDSVLQGGLTAVKRVDEYAGNMLSLVYEAKIDVVKIPDLMSNLATRGTDYSNELLRRLNLAAVAKGNNGMMVLDALEDYQQKSASFGTLDTIADRFMQLCSAAFSIPVTRLFGRSPGGLNSTGEGDDRAYYDRIRDMQATNESAMAILDECIIRDAIGDRPEEVFFNWRPLWQPTAKERAEVGKIVVDTIVALDGVGILPSEALAKSAVTALTESGAFHGLEAAVNEYGGIEASADDPSEENIDPPPALDRATYVSDLDLRRKLMDALSGDADDE